MYEISSQQREGDDEESSSARIPDVLQLKTSQRLYTPYEGDEDYEDKEEQEEYEKFLATPQVQQPEIVPTSERSPSPELERKKSNLEQLYTENLYDLLNLIKPHFMASESVDKILSEYFNFPSLSTVCEKIKKHPRILFQNIKEIDIHPNGFGQWLSLKSKEPPFRRQKLEHKELISILTDDGNDELDLRSYTKDKEAADEEYFKYLLNKYGTLFDNIMDQIDEFQFEEAEEKAAAAEAAANKKQGYQFFPDTNDDRLRPDLRQKNVKKLVKIEEEKEDDVDFERLLRAQTHGHKVQDVYTRTTNENRMFIFRNIFNDIERNDEEEEKPEIKSFVDGEKAMAKFFLSKNTIRGTRLPKDLRYHLAYDYIISMLEKNNIKSFNELQRLILYLVQRNFMGKRTAVNNLLICGEPYRGFKTAISATLFKRVIEYKELNSNGEAPAELRYNRNPYVLIIGLEEVDCMPIFNTIQKYLRGCQISMPHTFCTNVKLRQHLEGGCDIFVVDRKKLDFVLSGEIDLCNLRHVVILNVEMFSGNHEIHIQNIHRAIQASIEKKQYYNKELTKEELNVQYIFQTYQPFQKWDAFERLFYLTQPICDDLGLILNHDYNDLS